MNIIPSLDQTGFKLATWNVTAMSVSEIQTRSHKMRLLHALTKDHIVALQETKMTHEDANLLQLALPTIKVIATPALTIKEALSGGVALLIPTYIAEHSEVHILLDSYALPNQNITSRFRNKHHGGLSPPR